MMKMLFLDNSWCIIFFPAGEISKQYLIELYEAAMSKQREEEEKNEEEKTEEDKKEDGKRIIIISLSSHSSTARILRVWRVL